jgi:hypothetical protein
MKIKETFWFTEMGSTRPIGIVIGVDERTGEPKAYIGTAFGSHEGEDVQHIASKGAKLSPSTAKLIAKALG